MKTICQNWLSVIIFKLWEDNFILCWNKGTKTFLHFQSVAQCKQIFLLIHQYFLFLRNKAYFYQYIKRKNIKKIVYHKALINLFTFPLPSIFFMELCPSIIRNKGKEVNNAPPLFLVRKILYHELITQQFSCERRRKTNIAKNQSKI